MSWRMSIGTKSNNFLARVLNGLSINKLTDSIIKFYRPGVELLTSIY